MEEISGGAEHPPEAIAGVNDLPEPGLQIGTGCTAIKAGDT